MLSDRNSASSPIFLMIRSVLNLLLDAAIRTMDYRVNGTRAEGVDSQLI